MIRNIVAVVLGIILGSVVNMGLIHFGSALTPPPAGVDITDVESIRANIHLYDASHFLVPLIAHAVGTFVGALVAYITASSYALRFAYLIGGVFMAGGISAAYMIQGPLWFIVGDLVLAYIPMAWIACKVGAKFRRGEE